MNRAFGMNVVLECKWYMPCSGLSGSNSSTLLEHVWFAVDVGVPLLKMLKFGISLHRDSLLLEA
jgi:hypothetical protein